MNLENISDNTQLQKKKKIALKIEKNQWIYLYLQYHDLKLGLLLAKDQIKTMENKHKLIEEDLNIYNMLI